MQGACLPVPDHAAFFHWVCRNAHVCMRALDPAALTIHWDFPTACLFSCKVAKAL